MNTNKVVLPTERVEKAAIVHEEIKTERVKEVTPVINVEKLQTEVHQKTQPLLDKEVRPVAVSRTVDATETLPEVFVQSKSAPMTREASTVNVKEADMLVEKPAIFNEVDKMKVIEEIQPVIYKETVVPSLVQETKPFYQKVVEGPNYSQQTLATQKTANYDSARVDYHSVPRQNLQQERLVERLPTEVRQLPATLHEEIREEKVTEVQPVINIERLKTEVVQQTQPLLDKEIRPVAVAQVTRDTKVLPDVVLQSSSVAKARDVSTVAFQQATSMTVEKPTIINEMEKLKIVEEIQPVVYKETIVPEVIQETVPVFQKIIEGTTYTSEVLPPKMLHGSGFAYPTNVNFETTAPTNFSVPVQTTQTLPKQVPVQNDNLFAKKEAPAHNKKVIEETTTTTTTTTTTPVQRV